ncbi:AAA domain-containing protein [Amycolatopsis thermophila]|uniref:Very-short-patch-repair endonuclease/DNA polymerase III delta prime subunit n=1 Tax=Amycolatopsis thermophila TaxID=206084 RepID=A0ABU0EV63_9PSEU|nr:AAA domain-containing protein [Amycolatopsis thermophila]MDQ0379182.1 very-short-patch-repair endonuclease/DNA polymerase III delta prime subunit [Amycolatopsis thermophila]
MTAQVDTRRLTVVASKVDEWRRRLIDLSYRNTLLYFRDTKTATLDLTQADADALTALESGSRVRLRALVSDDELHRDACRRARNLSRKIRIFDEEQGIDVGRVAFGLVRTTARRNGQGNIPALRAPLLLRPLALTTRTATDSDFTLALTDEAELNPVLIHALDEHFGVEVERIEGVLETAAEGLTGMALAEKVHAQLAEAAGAQGVELTFERAVVVGTFNYVKLPMVEDLANATELLTSHDLVAALAGFEPAKEALITDSADLHIPQVDELNPSDEYLVQDADSSQHRAIMTALSGQHLLIEGPPGTGKSQTIANIIAGAAATGKKVLFVAEKRAAIEAVLNRLAEVGLDGLVFDLHQQNASKREVAQQLAQSLDRVTKEPPVDTEELHERLVTSRQRLLDHSRELHVRRDPWNISAYEVRAQLLDLPSDDMPGVFRGDRLRALNAATVREVERSLKDFVELDGLRILRGETPWRNADVRTDEDVRKILVELDQLADGTLRRGQEGMHRLLRQTGLAAPHDIEAWEHVLRLLDDVSKSVDAFGPEIFGSHLDAFHCATGDRKQRERYAPHITLSWKQRRALVKQLRAMSRNGLVKRPALHAALSQVLEQRDRWRRLGGQHTVPAQVVGLEEVMRDYQTLRTQLAAVAASARRPDLTPGPAHVVEQKLGELRDDHRMLFRMPTLNGHLQFFRRLGLDELLNQIAQRNLTAEQAWMSFKRIWLKSLDDEFRIQSRELGQFVPERQDRAADDFRAADTRHRAQAARRVRRQVARMARQAGDAYPEQTRVLRQQASRKSRHMATRKLVQQTSDVLLSLRPCWAMSPLVVSRMLPAERLFDLVVFDEASQIQPHDAITAIMRGDQLVVAGDEKQLPPSTYFERVLIGDGDEDENEDDLGDYESILTALRSVIPATQMLTWHYRSADERLISFSNREIYRDALVTFPGPAKDNPVTLELVNGEASPGQDGSAPAEVERVVELILHHARTRPGESLGVITPGEKHQARIERRLAQARRESPELDEFFSEDVELTRRFFVKNLESVQGDERDAIILSLGVARSASGRINRTSFGLLNRKGSERRVNVAVTRAKNRMTVVASFSAADLEPSPDLTGTELLRRYLDFAERLGRIEQVGSLDDVPLNGFERSIRDALSERGVPVYPQWGFSDYRIDFALGHRDQPGRMVLAVEADGERYHRAPSARDRDRLRQSHLEKLGWRFHRLWSSAWFADTAKETERIISAWQRAMDEADAPSAEDPVLESDVEIPEDIAVSRSPRPRVPAGLPIHQYTERQLVEVCRWLMTDRLHLSRDERLAQAMADLGFQRRGPRIVERLTAAIDVAQKLADQEED